MADREITFYTESMANLIANLKVKQRGLASSVVGHDETQWGAVTNGWQVWKNNAGTLFVGAVQKYYSGGAWTKVGNVFADVEVDQLYTDTGFRDQFLAADLLLSEAGETALAAGFTATSIVGALNELKNPGSVIVQTTRKTNADSPYTILAGDYYVALDTDGGAITANLPVGVSGTVYIVKNCGSSGNAITLTPNGAELLEGVNSSITINDGESFIVIYETTEGWRIV